MKNLELIPYIEIDGIPTFANSDILSIYDRIIEEGKEYIFKDGTICNGAIFLETMKNGQTALYVTYYKKEMLGIVWLNRFEGKLARVHWCTFDGFSAKQKIQAGRYINEKIMDMKDAKGNYVFDLLLGYTPVTNNKAIQFICFCGGIIGEVIPNLIWNNNEGKSEPGVISYYSRDKQAEANN